MDLEDRKVQLEEAKQHIEEGIELIRDAVRGTREESHANAYIIPHLMTWIGEGNPHDTSIPDYIDALEEEFGEESEE